MNLRLLRQRLDSLYRDYDGTYLSTDPLFFLHHYKEPDDIEVVGLVASSLAYGRVKMIQRNVRRVLEQMGRHPAGYVRAFDARSRSRDFAGISHRFSRDSDIVLLLHYMRQMMESAGSIGSFFRAGFDPNDRTIGTALCSFVDRSLALDCAPIYPDGVLSRNAGIRFFFPSPSGGSACKRLNLFLRWMARRDDGLDFGLWDFVSPSQLIIPLDTHVSRISGLIGLTSRKTPGWSMAVEITDNLKRLDPSDPVKYDFALCRLGILEKCPRVHRADTCGKCEIRDLCTRKGSAAEAGRGVRTRATGELAR